MNNVQMLVNAGSTTCQRWRRWLEVDPTYSPFLASAGIYYLSAIHCVILQTHTKNCITLKQRRPNVFDVGPALYKYYTNVLCLLGNSVALRHVASVTHCQFLNLSGEVTTSLIVFSATRECFINLLRATSSFLAARVRFIEKKTRLIDGATS